MQLAGGTVDHSVAFDAQHHPVPVNVDSEAAASSVLVWTDCDIEITRLIRRERCTATCEEVVLGGFVLDGVLARKHLPAVDVQPGAFAAGEHHVASQPPVFHERV